MPALTGTWGSGRGAEVQRRAFSPFTSNGWLRLFFHPCMHPSLGSNPRSAVARPVPAGWNLEPLFFFCKGKARGEQSKHQTAPAPCARCKAQGDRCAKWERALDVPCPLVSDPDAGVTGWSGESTLGHGVCPSHPLTTLARRQPACSRFTCPPHIGRQRDAACLPFFSCKLSICGRGVCVLNIPPAPSSTPTGPYSRYDLCGLVPPSLTAPSSLSFCPPSSTGNIDPRYCDYPNPPQLISLYLRASGFDGLSVQGGGSCPFLSFFPG